MCSFFMKISNLSLKKKKRNFNSKLSTSILSLKKENLSKSTFLSRESVHIQMIKSMQDSLIEALKLKYLILKERTGSLLFQKPNVKFQSNNLKLSRKETKLLSKLEKLPKTTTGSHFTKQEWLAKRNLIDQTFQKKVILIVRSNKKK